MSEGNKEQVNDSEGPPKKPKDAKAAKNAHYADACGIRKLISHCVRNLRIDRIPRVPRKRFWFSSFQNLPILFKNSKDPHFRMLVSSPARPDLRLLLLESS